jgi:hypothetical protein
MIRRFVALFTLLTIAGCIHVSGRGGYRHDRRARAFVVDCPALAEHGRDACESRCESACEEECEEMCEEECEEDEECGAECESKCEEACASECEEACESECEEECDEEDDDDDDDEDDDEDDDDGDHRASLRGESAVAAAPAAVGGADAAANLDDLKHSVAAAERKLKRAREELSQSAEDQTAAVGRARDELDDARRAIRHFEGVEKPTRLARAELDLKDTVDYMTAQDEEMKQLELLYEKDDLGDKTKEIVLARGRRSHQRAQERLAIAKREFEDLKGFQLEQQRKKLDRDHAEKERAVRRAEFTARITAEDKEQAVADAERALEKARCDVEKAAGGAK